MADKKSYPLRISAPVLDAMRRWSDDELRSLNAQIEYILRNALRKSGRLNSNQAPDDDQKDGDDT
ncbi:MAG: Arc family DNA binding domain-containing protein [Litorimonas sp.]